jgi:glucokinase
MPGAIAVDFGGTNIRAAYFAASEPPADVQRKVPTGASDGPDVVVGRLIGAIEGVLPPRQGCPRIGIGAPGPLDPRRGLILDAPNLPGWINIPLRELMESHFGCPVALGNDGNLAALAEWRYGAGRGSENVLYLTWGTGIGGGVIADGRLLLGHRGLAAEVGHMQVDPHGERCGCGQIGHLEAIAAGPAIARAARARIQAGEHSTLADRPGVEAITGTAVGHAAQAGDALSLSVLEEAAQAIGRHLASLAHAFNPEVIVVGGGVSELGRIVLAPMERALREHVMHRAYMDGMRLVPAELGDEAGLIGALIIARDLG